MAWMPILFTEEKGPEWIPCKERLPEEGDTVLVTVSWFEGNVEICIAKRYGDEYCFSDYGMQDAEKVQAWMPLPEPYEG